jgi:hypothetical protein
MKSILNTASVLVLLVGCEKNDGRVEVYPVSGTVLVDDRPAEGAKVVFYPLSEELKQPGMPVPYAFTGPDGGFRLRSYDPEDGAPAGEFNVSVFWPGASVEAENSGGEEMKEAKDRLGNRYLDPNKSGLKATVEEGGAELPPFKLQ